MPYLLRHLLQTNKKLTMYSFAQKVDKKKDTYLINDDISMSMNKFIISISQCTTALYHEIELHMITLLKNNIDKNMHEDLAKQKLYAADIFAQNMEHHAATFINSTIRSIYSFKERADEFIENINPSYDFKKLPLNNEFINEITKEH